MVNVNDFRGTCDNDVIEQAIAARGVDGIVVMPPRVSEIESERNYWLLDRAILLPENTTVVLQSCKIKLSDRCRDNFFRTANCGFGFPDPEPIKNVHIRGEGYCVLEGADHPRATGDSSKLQHKPCPHFPEDIIAIDADWVPAERKASGELDFWDIHNHSYGTDAGNPDESQYGDWRGIGVLFARAEQFSISGLKIVESHGWGISLEDCSYGRIEKIEFDARMYKEIDGMIMNMENQDGIDVRNGCHHITITDITGETGDDVIALTAVVPNNPVVRPGGSLRTTHVMHSDWSRRERDIHDIIIRNVTAYSYLCFVIRLLPANTKIYNVVIENVLESRPSLPNHPHGGTLLLGDGGGYGDNQPESMCGITVSNVVCNSNAAVVLAGYMKDSVLSNIVNRNPKSKVLYVDRPDGMTNVQTYGLVSAEK
ncbi:MAG: hypothetical protein IIX84_02780 [Oscillospiraceae bacterium]|nr:hypothetical protein [Oscillospiraceae bacterium]